MANKWRHDDDDDDAWSEGFSDEDDSLDEEDDSEDDDSPTVECPMCGCDVYDDADQCPVCGEWLVRTPRIWDGKPWWWIWLGVIGIIAVIWSLLFVMI